MTETLGLQIGKDHGAGLPGWEQGVPVFVQPGPVSLMLAGDWENLPSRSTLLGQLYLDERRAYARITEARTPSGETFPVCMELMSKGERGAAIRNGDGKGAVKIFPILMVKTVDYFE
ncbi:MAG TPA: hypothetical protein VLQ93_21355 [Myxococcaceae bacterium]|nr:hypothetical protein [Myxococcaceae bacterium]